ncbi:MAG TPA: zinc-ribbon domain-containing protein [Bryobacteraceae bacterium]|nr:zinc-ribbon domain-containing protein [Bryobacteraceae bacterium]
MFCHSCGAQVSSDLQFCPNCGQPLAPGAPLNAPPPLAPQPPLAPVVWTPPVGIKATPGRWIGAGWEIVKADMLNLALMAVVVGALSSAVPIVLQGPLMVGFHLVLLKKMNNRPSEFGDLFKGFDFFVPSLVASLLIGLFTSLGVLACLVGALVVGAMFKFTYLFILDKRMDFWPAMQASHAVVKNDYFGFTMFLLLIGLVNLLGALCCIVGVFVTMPVGIAAITVAYREIVGFEQRTLDTL